ncbi:MAG: acetyl-CoA carboxylase biotin carboxyl carrier protein [Bacillus sp. (in: firmicutes)]
MLKVQEIRELIKLVDASSINDFVYEHDGTKVEMKKNIHIQPLQAEQQASLPVMEQAVPVQAPQSPTASSAAVQTKPESVSEQVSSDEELHTITSPMVGTFYQSPSPDTKPYVTIGSRVSEDQVVCIVEAMKLFNEITAEVNGEIVELLVKDGQLVEYGQPLFLVKPE